MVSQPTSFWGLHSNFIKCESFLKSNPPGILALCVTNLSDSKDSGNFSMRGHLLLILKNSVAGMYGLAIYAKKRLPVAQELSIENFVDSYSRFCLTLLHSMSYFFFFCRLPSLSWCRVFDAISSNIDEELIGQAFPNSIKG